jgi:uncharacterized protein
MYVIGMDPKSSHLARVSLYPTMVFNLHEQFARLPTRRKFETMNHAIRMRQMTFPMPASFGENSEAHQYSGRVVPAYWSYPSHSQKYRTR